MSNKFLLWYGVKSSSVMVTLREGIQVPTSRSKIGLMFGPGIYLTDCFSKAAKNTTIGGQGIVFLAEAALGDMHFAYEPDQFQSGLPRFAHSVFGVG